MQKMLGYMRKAIQEFDLISDGDSIAVGVSGGKDSLVLIEGLRRLQRFIGIDYRIVGVTLDPGFDGVRGDYSQVEEYLSGVGVEYHVIPTEIGDIVFNRRQEKHPCSLCAKMRRGALHEAAIEYGCNKIALGHHFDDAVETFLMNLFTEGRIGCFSPKSYLSRRKLTVIRPMVLAPEKDVRHGARQLPIEVVKSKCPADGHTNRERMKQFIREQNYLNKGFSDRIFGAMRRANIDGWGGVNYVPILREEDLQ